MGYSDRKAGAEIFLECPSVVFEPRKGPSMVWATAVTSQLYSHPI